jgi:hypothetical protein
LLVVQTKIALWSSGVCFDELSVAGATKITYTVAAQFELRTPFVARFESRPGVFENALAIIVPIARIAPALLLRSRCEMLHCPGRALQ